MTSETSPGRPLITCHLDTETSWRGGQQQVLYLMRGLKALGHTVYVATPKRSELAKRAASEGISVIPIRLWGPFNPLASAKLTSDLRERKVDVLHLHTGRACTVGGFVGRYEKNLSLVITRRVDFPLSSNRAVQFKYGRHVSKVIAISRGVRDVLVESGVDGNRIEIVHSGIDLSRWDHPHDAASFRRRHGIPAGAPLIGTVGALTDHKGHTYLIKAFPLILKEFPDAHLVLVGDGELREPLAQEAAATGCSERIHFAGFVDDVGSALAAFDVFALSSHLEGLCTSVLDAMAMGVPVVATAVGGVPDAVREGETGLLVPARAPEALAAGIVRMLRSPELSQALAARAKEMVQSEFSVERMVEGTLAVYARSLSDRVSGFGSRVSGV